MRPLKVEEVLLLATLEQLVEESDATDKAVPRNDLYEAMKPAACNEHDLISKDGCVALGSDKDGDPDESRLTITDKGRKALREQGPKAIERARKDMASWRNSPRTTPEMVQAQEDVIGRLESHLGIGQTAKSPDAATPAEPQRNAKTAAGPRTRGVRPPTAKP